MEDQGQHVLLKIVCETMEWETIRLAGQEFRCYKVEGTPVQLLVYKDIAIAAIDGDTEAIMAAQDEWYPVWENYEQTNKQLSIGPDGFGVKVPVGHNQAEFRAKGV